MGHIAGEGPFAQWQKTGFDRHSLVADPLFVDPSKGDFTLRPASPALKLGFEPIDTSKIGLLRKRCRCQTPSAFRWFRPYGQSGSGKAPVKTGME